MLIPSYLGLKKMLRRTEPGTLRCGKQLLNLSTPVVMGILNTTPDSFYPESRVSGAADQLLERAEAMLSAGCAILDVGGMSSRPGAEAIPADEELNRVLPAVKAIHRHFPDAIISVDTYRSGVAAECIAAGASMVNDISGGKLDPNMIPMVSSHAVAYVVMHMRGTPADMQQMTDYQAVVPDIIKYFVDRIRVLKRAGVEELVIDPGFGFSKTMAQNYEIIRNLGAFQCLGFPVMIGVSRKSTLSSTIGRPVEETLEATTALHMAALLNGASILRVHDVEAAMDTIAVYRQLSSVNTLNPKVIG